MPLCQISVDLVQSLDLFLRDGRNRSTLFGCGDERSEAFQAVKMLTGKTFSTSTRLVLVLAMAGPLFAGSILNHEMSVSVPFGFVVAGKILPAGDYSAQVNPERGTVVLHCVGRSPMMLLTIPRESDNAPHRGKLVFQRYGATIFLAEVWNQGNTTGQKLRQSEAEKELTRQKQPDQIFIVQSQ